MKQLPQWETLQQTKTKEAPRKMETVKVQKWSQFKIIFWALASLANRKLPISREKKEKDFQKHEKWAFGT